MTMDTLPLDALAWLAICAWIVLGIERLVERWRDARASVDQASSARSGLELPAGSWSVRHPFGLGYLGAMGAKSAEHGVANDHVQEPEVHERSEEQANDQRSIHGRMVHLPPGVPSITERLDPWVLDQLSEDDER